MCLFVQNQDFQRHTEFVLNLLYAAGADAAQRLVALNGSMAAHAAALGGVQGQLRDISHQQVQRPPTSLMSCDFDSGMLLRGK